MTCGMSRLSVGHYLMKRDIDSRCSWQKPVMVKFALSYDVGGVPIKSRLPISTPHCRMMS